MRGDASFFQQAANNVPQVVPAGLIFTPIITSPVYVVNNPHSGPVVPLFWLDVGAALNASSASDIVLIKAELALNGGPFMQVAYHQSQYAVALNGLSRFARGFVTTEFLAPGFSIPPNGSTTIQARASLLSTNGITVNSCFTVILAYY